MLRIEKDTDECVSRVRVSGRIQADSIPSIQASMNERCARTILDLTEVTLVDITAVRFLIDCEREGIELEECPLWVREWIARERAEGVYSQQYNSAWRKPRGPQALDAAGRPIEVGYEYERRRPRALPGSPRLHR